MSGYRWAGAVATAALALLTGASTATAARPAVTPAGLADLPAVKPVKQCADVTGFDLTGVTDANVTIASATVVTANTPAPYCEVRGTIAPANTIVVRLPVNGWTQRYVQTGCGGLCGSANINYGQAAGCSIIADGTVASATTDMGHQGQNDGSWAVNNPQAQIDFAYRGVHVTAQVAKALIAKFYGQAPRYSYFTGCSDGGREALMEAQRYPDDFDGIAAGAPANNMVVQNTYHHAWPILINKDASGNAVLLSGKLPLIHAAVVKACDAIDGTTDGLLDDPRKCDFDPLSLLCATGQDAASCLSRAEAAVVQKIHDGAVDTHGVRLEPEIAREWGSELLWNLFVPSTPTGSVMAANFALSYLRYLAEPNHPNPNYQLADLPLTLAGFWKTILPSQTYMAAMDPNLATFARSGGKLLLWHGWQDQHISPQNTLAYYDAMRGAMGDRTVNQMSRLYLFPGVGHCSGGEGPNQFDVLTPVMAWVESGRAPGAITATGAAGTKTTHPYTPERRPQPGYHWAGEILFSHGYQTWPRAVNGKLVLLPGWIV